MRRRRIVVAALLLAAFTASTPQAAGFVHPGISHSQADLDRMKNHINVEPYKTAFTAFRSQGYSQSTNTGQGPMVSETIGAGKGQFEIRNDAQVAHQNAVMWYVTGDTAYRTNAINIMNGWARTLTSFNPEDILTAGTAMFDFCNAAEIIRATGKGAWTESEITIFKKWLITHLHPPLLLPGKSPNGGTLAPAGFGGLQIKGLLALGVFSERKDIYDFGVSSYLHDGKFSYGITEYIDDNGQNYENQRDVGHPSGNLGAFMESGYVILNQGRDVLGTANNLLARAFESQAKFDLGWDVAPIPFTTADGRSRTKMSGDGRTPYDNLMSDLAYWFFHDVKGLEMPYTKISADFKFPSNPSAAFYYRRDDSGVVPVKPLIGEPAATGVRLYEDLLSGGYLTNFPPGDYSNRELRKGGMQLNDSGLASSMRVPLGWTVTAYDADNFKGESVVLTGTLENNGLNDLVAANFNDRLVSMKVVGAPASTYVVAPSTYKLVNRKSGKVAEVASSSTAKEGNVQQATYTGARNQLWRVEDMGAGGYRIQNLSSNMAMQVAGASLANGGLPTAAGNVDQAPYLLPSNIANGGTATASGGTGGEGATQAFDGNIGSKWFSPAAGGIGWLQYQLPTAKAVVQYTVTSANDAPERDPAAWQFQGSNDGTTWTTLHTQTDQVFAGRQQTNTYAFANTTGYVYYRLNVTAAFGGASFGIQLSEMALYPDAPGAHQRWTIVPANGAAYGGFLKILNANSGGTLDVFGDPKANGANVIQAIDTSSERQQWLLQAP